MTYPAPTKSDFAALQELARVKDAENKSLYRIRAELENERVGLRKAIDALRTENAELRAKHEALRIMLETEEVAALRADNERLRAELKRAGSAGTLGKRIAALSEENTRLRAQVETLTGLCGEVEQWLRLKVALHASFRDDFKPWLKRFRALKGKR